MPISSHVKNYRILIQPKSEKEKIAFYNPIPFLYFENVLKLWNYATLLKKNKKKISSTLSDIVFILSDGGLDSCKIQWDFLFTDTTTLIPL